MGSVFKKSTISEKERNEILSIIFVKLAEKGEIDDEIISEHPHLFKEWSNDWKGGTGSIVFDKGKLYRANNDMTENDGVEPHRNTNKWKRIGGRR